MNRRSAVQFLLAALASPLTLRAQPARMPARIGVLSSTTPEARSTFWEGFKQGMAKLGWVEGRNVTYVYRYARGDVTRFDVLAAELVAEKPDLIFAGTQGMALAAKRATREIPIVFGLVPDPVGIGLVASLSKPGGNATGLSSLSLELSAKHIELLKEIRPQLRHVAVMVAPTAYGRQQIKVAERAARAVGVEARVIQLGNVEELGQAFESLARQRPDGVLMYAGAMVERRQVAERMAELRVPAIYNLSEYVAAGGLISYGADLSDNYRRAARYADLILKGAKPADLPVEQPTSFELVVNLKAARAQGITIPQSVLLRATRVIE